MRGADRPPSPSCALHTPLGAAHDPRLAAPRFPNGWRPLLKWPSRLASLGRPAAGADPERRSRVSDRFDRPYRGIELRRGVDLGADERPDLDRVASWGRDGHERQPVACGGRGGTQTSQAYEEIPPGALAPRQGRSSRRDVAERDRRPMRKCKSLVSEGSLLSLLFDGAIEDEGQRGLCGVAPWRLELTIRGRVRSEVAVACRPL